MNANRLGAGFTDHAATDFEVNQYISNYEPNEIPRFVRDTLILPIVQNVYALAVQQSAILSTISANTSLGAEGNKKLAEEISKLEVITRRTNNLYQTNKLYQELGAKAPHLPDITQKEQSEITKKKEKLQKITIDEIKKQKALREVLRQIQVFIDRGVVIDDIKKTNATDRELLTSLENLTALAVEEKLLAPAERTKIIEVFRLVQSKHIALSQYSPSISSFKDMLWHTFFNFWNFGVGSVILFIVLAFLEVESALFVAGFLLAGGTLFPIFTYVLEKMGRSGAQRNVNRAHNDAINRANILLADLRSTTEASLRDSELRVQEMRESFNAGLTQSQYEAEASLVRIRSHLGKIFDDGKNEVGVRGIREEAGWESPIWDVWTPSREIPRFVHIGRLTMKHEPSTNVDLSLETFPEIIQMALPELDLSVQLPALVKFAPGAPILIDCGVNGYFTQSQRQEAIGALQSMSARLLAMMPPGKVRFTFIDPQGLGLNAAPFIPLADYDESLITSRAVSQEDDIDKLLKEITEHMETVIQRYLRHEYESIEEYNRKANEIAVPYRVLVVFDYPVNFNRDSALRLLRVVENGPRCGVYAMILAHFSSTDPCLHVESASRVTFYNNGRVVWSDAPADTFTLELAPPCAPELLNRIIAGVGEAAKAEREQAEARAKTPLIVPFGQVLGLAGYRFEEPGGWWRVDGAAAGAATSSREGLTIPLGLLRGPNGRLLSEVQALTLNDDTPHGLIAGQTGKGKSNLLHIIITSLAVKYPPQELELYLVDLKGVEFAVYARARLPHARVIATDSGREFGLKVLEGLEQARAERTRAFKEVGVADLRAFRGSSPQPMARIVLIIDEFQELFAADDEIARQAKGLLDGLVRKGRSFGIHLILVSQSLGGSAWDLGRVVFDQMAIRIALPCSDADSRLILADNNPAAFEQLTRAGEAIYNDAKGLPSGNRLFQVARLDNRDENRQSGQAGELDRYLSTLGAKAAALSDARRPLIFEGDAAADLSECAPLAKRLKAAAWPAAVGATEVWLGAPMAMEETPTSVSLARTSGANLLVVTREEDEGVGVLIAALWSLAAQHRPGTARVFIIDLSTPSAPWAGLADELADQLGPHPLPIQVVSKKREIAALLEALVVETRRRQGEEADAASWSGYLLILGLQRARDLRPDPDGGYRFGEEETIVGPAEQFATLLRDGAEVGIHTLLWCDTYPNLARTLEARALREFAYRILGPMSENDSLRLLDDAAASRLDRPHQLLKYDDQRAGELEKFRPYRIPATAWLEHTAQTLRGRAR